MSKLCYCEECGEEIEWNEYVVTTEDGELYHERCCDVFPIKYGVMIGDDYIGESEEGPEMACIHLDEGEYLEEESE